MEETSTNGMLPKMTEPKDWTVFEVEPTEGMPTHLIGYVRPDGLIHTRCGQGVATWPHEIQHGATVLSERVTCLRCRAAMAMDNVKSAHRPGADPEDPLPPLNPDFQESLG